MGAFPLHASTVGLIRNLCTNHISPQFHVLYDDLFETVHASASKAPASWSDLFTFIRFKSDYGDADFVPTLPDEWLTPVELSQRQQQEQAQRSQDGEAPLDDSYIPEPNGDETPPQTGPLVQPAGSERAPSERAPVASERAPDGLTPESAGPQRAPLPQALPASPPPVEPAEAPLPTPVRRNPQRNRRAPQRYWQHGYSIVKSYCRAMTGALLLTQGQAYDNRFLLNLLLDPNFGPYGNLGPASLLMHPHAMKASVTPRLHEAMRGEHREDFLIAMGKEISELKAHGT
jgi:hypothetical protein